MADETMKTPLLEDFVPVSTEDWMAKTTADLKGADFNKKLVWRTMEGFTLKPLHRAEDTENVALTNAKPGEFPYVRGNSKTNNDWDIRQDLSVESEETANAKALDILNKGITSLGFDVREKDIDMSTLMKNICTECVSTNFLACDLSLNVLQQFAKVAKKEAKGSVNFAPYSKLAARGGYYTDESADLDTAKELISFAKENLPNFKVINIVGFLFHNSGATTVQELAFTLAKGSEYLAKLIEKGLSVDEIAPRIQFTFATGANYFMEIAKYRAARFLWAKIVKAYGGSDESCKMFIHAVTSKWNQTIFDPNVNMLRNTTEAMSAVIGGVDSFEVLPHNIAYEKSSDFSERIARNVQLLLKEESYLDKIVDPSAGSYYIETLTNNLISEAWNLFKEVEGKGGFVEALKAGFVQEQVEASAQKRDMSIATRRQVLLGTNQFPNFTETISDNINEEIVNTKIAPVEKPEVKPLKMYRGAEAFEALRLKTEKIATTPKAFMLTYGNLAMRKARAMFSCNFFACAGFETVDNNGFASAEEGAKAALEAGANIVVLCSADDEYVEMAKAAKETIGDKAIIVVAGNPKEADAIKEAGVTDFIHVRTNVLESLTDFQNRLM